MPLAVSRSENPVKRWLGLCVAAMLVLVAACGCSHDGGSAPKAAGVHVPENFCSLLSASEISQVMGSAYPEAQGKGRLADQLGVPLVSDAKFMDYVRAVADGTGVDDIVDAAQTGEQFALF